MTLSTIDAAVADLQAGKFVIIVDDEDRENEGDLVIAAEYATPEAMNFMAREGRGLLCIAMEGKRVDELKLPLMVPQARNQSGFGTNFTVSVEARTGVTTGISAYDRARTVAVLIDETSTPSDIVSPGHMFPLRAVEGGVLARRGQTEGSVDLARIAGLKRAAVICEVMAEDGTMARLPELERFAAEHEIKIISVEALVQYRRRLEGPEIPLSAATTARPPVTRVDTAALPSTYGRFQVTAYRDSQQKEHLAIVHGDLAETIPMVRIHSECVTGDLLGSMRCDCGDQLQAALRRIGESTSGLVIYLRQEGRGIGLANKIRAYALQDQGMDTVEANLALGFPVDSRDFRLAAAILRDQGIAAVRLLTNNPQKVRDLRQNGIDVVERVPHQFGLRAENLNYLRTKAEKLEHDINL